MACGGNCCGSAQTSLESELPKREPLTPSSLITSTIKNPSSSRPSCDMQIISRGERECCSPSKNDNLHVDTCHAQQTKTFSATSTGAETRKSDCCLQDAAVTSSVDAYPRNVIQAIDDLQQTSSSRVARPSLESSCQADCCAINKKNDTTVDTLELPSDNRILGDVEKSGTGTEHVVLSISGMTCTGCETKLHRTLATLPYLSQLRTSLILARAEFDIDLSAASVEDIIKHLTRTTEFECKQILMQGSSFDLACMGRSAEVVSTKWPRGVIDMHPLDKDTVRVVYSPSTVGARDLIESGWNETMQLAPLRPNLSLEAGKKHVWHVGLMTLLSVCFTIPVLVMAWAHLPDHETAYSSASLALATIVQVCIAGPFYPKALKALVYSRVIEMDLLIVLSTSAAYIFSVVSFGFLMASEPLSTGEFFETSTLLVTLIMVGRWVASLARQKAAESISIRSLQSSTAILVHQDGRDKVIDARLLQYGDIFKVAPDSQIPTDGTVVKGSSEVNESMLTGESKPIEKHTGSTVIAGSINGSGLLTVRLTRIPGDNTITTIASMVDEAKLSKPPVQDIADKVASYFVPVVVSITIVTFVIWVAIGVAVRKQSGSRATIEAITYAITVLIVSCPCAIGLAVPMVIVIASGVAAQHGVVFKSAESIEVAYKTTDVVFDKTGTLTLGQLAVADESIFNLDPTVARTLLLGLVRNVKHPVSAGVASHLLEEGVNAISIQDVKVVTGSGVQGTWHRTLLRAGNAQWLGLNAHSKAKELLSKGLTVTCFTIDDNIVAIYGLQDTIRPDAAFVISELQRRDIAVHILSGDDDGAVQAVATRLSIPSSNVRSRASPGDKREYIRALQTRSLPSQGSKKPRKPVIVFVGDGTNDAVALAQATVGVHMSSGTDIAQSAADVVLMRSDLSAVLTLLTISRKAMHRVAFNFGWSFVYNTLAVLLGAGAFVNARIPPELAGLGELVSVLPVIAAAVLLRWTKL